MLSMINKKHVNYVDIVFTNWLQCVLQLFRVVMCRLPLMHSRAPLVTGIL